MNEQTDTAEAQYQAGELIGVELFLRLCNRYGVVVPKQTIGMLRARFEGIARDRFTFRAVRGKGKPDITWLSKVVWELNQKISAV